MRYFLKFINGICNIGSFLGAAFLMSVVVVMCANIAYRAVGGIIAGTFDLVELFIVPAVGFALVLVEFRQQNTVVDMVTIHLKKKLRSNLATAVTIISFFYWAILCWVGFQMMLKKMATGEETQLLHLSVLPFRAIWSISLACVCLVIIRNLIIKYRETGDNS